MTVDRELTKSVVGIVTSLSVGKVIGDIVGATANPENSVQKAEIVVGSYVLASMIVKHAKSHMDQQVDIVYDWIEARKGQKLEYKSDR